MINYIRTRISFALLKSILVSIHGVRGKKEKCYDNVKHVSGVAFGLIPTEAMYESS